MKAHIPFPGPRNQTTNRTRVRERRDASCFRKNYGTSGPVLTSNTYSTDEACIELCLNTSGFVIHSYNDYNVVGLA